MCYKVGQILVLSRVVQRNLNSVLSVLMMFQGSSKIVSRKFQGVFKFVSRLFEEYFMGAL